jgi:Zn-dependent protease with chaperone function
MKNIFSNLFAISLLSCSFIVNGYILALCLGFIYSLLQEFFGTLRFQHYSNTVFLLYSFGIIILLLLLGLFDSTLLLTKMVTSSREPLQNEKDKINILLKEVLLKINLFKTSADLTPKLPIKVLVSDKITTHASAYGIKTIVVGTMLLTNYPDAEIKAVLIHEIAHLYHKDGIITLAMFWLNLPLQLIMWLFRKYAQINTMIWGNFRHNPFYLLAVIPLILLLPLILLNFISTIFIKVIFSLISRVFEYNADKFTAKCGYGTELISFLHKEKVFEANTTLASILVATHPSIVKRITKLEKLNT